MFFAKLTTKEKITPKVLDLDNIRKVYGIRNLNFEESIERKEELSKHVSDYI